MKKHGLWTIKRTEQRYADAFIEFHVDEVIKPDGSEGEFAVARMLPGVSTLALDADGFVYLGREFRYAIGRESLETASGAVDEGEAEADAARRELKEELGIEADELIDLGLVDAVTSQVYSPARLFLARGLRFRESEQEGTEEIEVVRVKLEAAVEMVMRAEITHAVSCTLILKAQEYLRREASL
ncbi:MAG TPA: NUDIX hydrolase [Pyrinomonadaceae bacterium]|nr:NUDIX hydrolase [Pyrinomonadaceae bacterium]